VQDDRGDRAGREVPQAVVPVHQEVYEEQRKDTGENRTARD